MSDGEKIFHSRRFWEEVMEVFTIGVVSFGAYLRLACEVVDSTQLPRDLSSNRALMLS